MLETLAASISIGWKKWQKQITAVFFAVFLTLAGLFLAPSTPAGAISSSSVAATTSIETQQTAAAESHQSSSISTTVLTQLAAPTGSNCNEQLGALGWIVCPATGAIAKAIDFIYDLLGDLLKVNPLTSDRTSPVYIVWEYSRSITNVVFVIFLIVIIISQITGLGFLSNYSIKKALPRIVIAAVLVNLSFIICALAVDVSNILGFSLRGLFVGVQETISASADLGSSSMRWDDLVAVVLAGGAIGGTAIGLAGGIAAFIWMLVPAALGAVVAVIAGLLTLAARQALVTVLIMIAPLAFVAYLLPNTETWFKKWKDTLLRMLIFFPMFSVLFGASQLAGFAIIASANGNAALVILGMAVQIFPLIFSVSLMKMSGTVLGKFNDLISRPLTAATKPISKYADEMRNYHSERQRAIGTSGSAAFRRYMSDRQARRLEDTSRFSDINKLRGKAFSSSSVYDRQGRLTRRGEQLYNLQNDELQAQNTIKRIENDFEEGIGDINDRRIRDTDQFNRLDATNKKLTKAVDTMHFQNSRAESIKLDNLESHADRISQARELDALSKRSGRTQEENIRLAKLQSDPNNTHRLREIETTAGALGEKGINNIIATAISMKTKADHDARDNYNVLFEQTARTKDIEARFNQSIVDGNYNEMEAAIQNLALRGDYDLIVNGLVAHGDAHNLNLNMQKHLADTLIRYKADSAPLATYAKALNIRRGKAANGADINEFVSFKDFATGALQPGDNADIASSLTLSALLNDIADPAIAATQDRNTFDFILKMAQKKQLLVNPEDPQSILGFRVKQLRSAASSGRMDGEQLGNLNALLTGGFKTKKNSATGELELAMKPEAETFFTDKKALIHSNIQEYLAKMSGGQLGSMKESTFTSLNQTLCYMENGNLDAFNSNPDYVNGTLKDWLSRSAIPAISRPSAAAMRATMNTEIARKLGIHM